MVGLRGADAVKGREKRKDGERERIESESAQERGADAIV